MFSAGLGVDHRLVDVHRRARLLLHRLGHEGREAVVPERRLADRALEEEHLVGELHRVAVQQVDLDLPGAALLDDRVDLEALRLGEVVDVVDHLAVLVDRAHRVGLPADTICRPVRPDRRLDRLVRVQVRLDQVELHLRRHHRPPALGLVERHHPLQHVARRHRAPAGRRGPRRCGSPAASRRRPRGSRSPPRSRASAPCPTRSTGWRSPCRRSRRRSSGGTPRSAGTSGPRA